jgi:hypothetical protein
MSNQNKLKCKRGFWTIKTSNKIFSNSMSVCPSIFLFICLSIFTSVRHYLFVGLFILLSVSQSVFPSVRLYILLSVCLSVSFSVYLSSVLLFVCRWVRPSISSTVYLSVYPFSNLSVHRSPLWFCLLVCLCLTLFLFLLVPFSFRAGLTFSCKTRT